jgi:hypothetical protein
MRFAPASLTEELMNMMLQTNNQYNLKAWAHVGRVWNEITTAAHAGKAAHQVEQKPFTEVLRLGQMRNPAPLS